MAENVFLHLKSTRFLKIDTESTRVKNLYIRYLTIDRVGMSILILVIEKK